MSKDIQKLNISKKILTIRGLKVMLDRDLAELYGVEIRVLNQAVTRNIKRFPDDFMFKLSWDEAKDISRSQNVILKKGKNIKYRPRVFTEQGVAMLSSVLRSERAILINIQIMRVFTKLRAIVQDYKEIVRRLDSIEKRQNIEGKEIWKAIRALQRKVLT